MDYQLIQLLYIRTQATRYDIKYLPSDVIEFFFEEVD